MKYMNVKRKYLPPLDLQLFADDSDSGADGDDAGDDDTDDDLDEDEEEEKKFSQKEVDDAVKKRIARERRKWQREQQKKPVTKPNGEDKPGGTDKGEEETDSDKKAREAEEKAAALELKWTCLEHDVRKDCVDDVLALAKVHISKNSDLDIEDAIDKVLEKYPQFKDGYDEGEEAGEGSDEKKKGWGQRHGKPSKKSTTVDDEIKKQLFGK